MSPESLPPRTEYVLDVPYPRSFVHQSSPAMLRLVAALNGLSLPAGSTSAGDAFTYCDLGTGTGDTLLTFAAAHPQGRFFGVDFHPEQIAAAKARAQRAGLTNVEMIECDFSALAGRDLPPLDFLVAHGIWTWVSAEKRAAILAFARARLKPGGLFYVSYDALPAWSAVEPLRRLMLEHTRAMKTPTEARARAGYEHAKKLADAEAGYFRAHPTARSMLALMDKAGLGYVAHEYFHEHWEPMYIADVARSLESVGLSYVGQVPLHLNVPELSLPPKVKELARTLTNRIDLEMLKDMALNEPFRADVYVLDVAATTGMDATRRSYFEETVFGLLAPLPLVQREVPLVPFTLDFSGPVYDAVLAALARSPASARALVLQPELAHLGFPRVADVLQNLVLGGQVAPVRAGSDAAAGTTSAATARLLTAFNRVELEDALASDRAAVIAAPSAGVGLSLRTLDAVGLYVWTSVAPGKRKSWLRTFARQSKVPLRVSGRVVTDNEERTRLLDREVDRFASQWGATMRTLGVVD